MDDDKIKVNLGEKNVEIQMKEIGRGMQVQYHISKEQFVKKLNEYVKDILRIESVKRTGSNIDFDFTNSPKKKTTFKMTVILGETQKTVQSEDLKRIILKGYDSIHSSVRMALYSIPHEIKNQMIDDIMNAIYTDEGEKFCETYQKICEKHKDETLERIVIKDIGELEKSLQKTLEKYPEEQLNKQQRESIIESILRDMDTLDIDGGDEQLTERFPNLL